MRRIAALLLAAVVGAVGILPLVDSYRCVEMERVAVRKCCKSSESDETKFERPCCERIEARMLEARAQTSHDAKLAPPSVIGTVAQLSEPLAIVARAPSTAVARGAPPGDRLHRLSAVLRV